MRSFAVLLTRVLLCGAMLLSFSIGAAFAQSQATTGVIQGTITDTSGAVVPGSRITIRNVDTGIERVVSTDDAGRFVVPLLPLGKYRITAEREGFTTLVRE